ncbi:MAG TPA: aminotransferase class V-fold PLP-dependent enzyme, partial [Actinomycetota bacterium]|nr:aminotransferase class V-fold PLP-dependent enzyme [Actinomycetota bacterium]
MTLEASRSMLAPELEAFRAQVPLLGSTIYLANCSQGPLSNPVRAAVDAFLATWADAGMHWEAWVGEVERARTAFADAIGADASDVAVGTSESQLVSSLVSALVTRPDGGRRRILTSVAEFPGVAHAWMGAAKHGWRVDHVPWAIDEALSPGAVVDLIDDPTAVVSIPHVVYANGALVDPIPVVDEAHRRGALVFLDAYQSVGTMPIDARELGVDFLAAGALKYLMGTAGVAFLYVSPEVRGSLKPAATGWFGRTDPFAFDPATLDYPAAASRFDLGTPPILNAYVARAGIELVAGTGPAAIRAQVERLSAVAFEAAGELGLRVLGPASPEEKGAATAIDAGDVHRASRAEEALRERSIVVAA